MWLSASSSTQQTLFRAVLPNMTRTSLHAGTPVNAAVLGLLCLFRAGAPAAFNIFIDQERQRETDHSLDNLLRFNYTYYDNLIIGAPL